MSYYGSVEYWNERYLQKGDGYEWYKTYSAIKDIILKYIDKEGKILNVGCGDSNLSEDMYRDGYYDIVSCDYSNVVISKMKEACKDKSGLKWDVQDIHKMTYDDNTFDTVIDKATLDAIICGDEGVCNPEKVINEIYRVLKPNGVYICITYGVPEARLEYFQNPDHNWKVTHITIPKSENSGDTCHHAYICRKPEFFVC